MKNFKEHVLGVVEEGAIPEEILFFKKMLETSTGLSMKLTKKPQGLGEEYGIIAISPKGIELGETMIYFYENRWTLFGQTNGVFLNTHSSKGMDGVKKIIEKEFKKKFGDVWYGGKTPKEYGKDRTKQTAILKQNKAK